MNYQWCHVCPDDILTKKGCTHPSCSFLFVKDFGAMTTYMCGMCNCEPCECKTRKSSATVQQVGGTHYSKTEFQHWDLDRWNLPYLEGVASKYLVRLYKPKKTTDLEDLEKCKSYIVKLLHEYRLHGRQPKMDITKDILNVFMNNNEMNSTAQRLAFIYILTWKDKTELELAIKELDTLIDWEKQKLRRRTEHPRPFGYEGDR